MKVHLLLILISFYSLSCVGQNKESHSIDSSKIIKEPPMINPQFPGGDNAMFKFLAKKTRYPAVAREQNIQGTIYLSFIVQEDGSITNIKVLKGLGGGLDEEAIRVIQLMPKWLPGIYDGKPRETTINFPFKFTLAND